MFDLEKFIHKYINSDITDLEELNNFIVYYVKEEKNEDINLEQLKIIVTLIRQGFINLDFCINNILSNPNKYKLACTKLYAKNGDLLKVFIKKIE